VDTVFSVRAVLGDGSGWFDCARATATALRTEACERSQATVLATHGANSDVVSTS